MPPLVWCRRRWRTGSDDFVVPGISYALVCACFGAAAVWQFGPSSPTSAASLCGGGTAGAAASSSPSASTTSTPSPPEATAEDGPLSLYVTLQAQGYLFFAAVVVFLALGISSSIGRIMEPAKRRLSVPIALYLCLMASVGLFITSCIGLSRVYASGGEVMDRCHRARHHHQTHHSNDSSAAAAAFLGTLIYVHLQLACGIVLPASWWLMLFAAVDPSGGARTVAAIEGDYHQYHGLWFQRLHILRCCCGGSLFSSSAAAKGAAAGGGSAGAGSSSATTIEAFQSAAQSIAVLFKGLELVPSDIAAGMLLVQGHQQRVMRERAQRLYASMRHTYNSASGGSHMTANSRAAVADGSSTQHSNLSTVTASDISNTNMTAGAGAAGGQIFPPTLLLQQQRSTTGAGGGAGASSRPSSPPPGSLLPATVVQAPSAQSSNDTSSSSALALQQHAASATLAQRRGGNSATPPTTTTVETTSRASSPAYIAATVDNSSGSSSSHNNNNMMVAGSISSEITEGGGHGRSSDNNGGGGIASVAPPSTTLCCCCPTTSNTSKGRAGDASDQEYAGQQGQPSSSHRRRSRRSERLSKQAQPVPPVTLQLRSDLDVLYHYRKYYMAAYGWKLYVFERLLLGLPELVCFNPLMCCGKGHDWHDDDRNNAANSVSSQNHPTNTGAGSPPPPFMLGGSGGCCHCDANAMLKVTGLPPRDVLYTSFVNEIFRPAYFVAIDRSGGSRDVDSVVIAVRGSMSLEDAVTDACATPSEVPVDGDYSGERPAYCHSGFLRCAENILADLEAHGMVADILKMSHQRTNAAHHQQRCVAEEGGVGGEEDYSCVKLPRRVTVLGHSLGAGTAVILSVLLRARFPQLIPRLSCVAYAPPGGLLSADLSTFAARFVVGGFMGFDVVPRMALHTLEELRGSIIDALCASKDKKATIFCRCLCPKGTRLLADHEPLSTEAQRFRDVMQNKAFVPGSGSGTVSNNGGGDSTTASLASPTRASMNTVPPGSERASLAGGSRHQQQQAFAAVPINEAAAAAAALQQRIRLYPPARLVHLVKMATRATCCTGCGGGGGQQKDKAIGGGKTGSCTCCCDSGPSYGAVGDAGVYVPTHVGVADVQEILCAPQMLFDHFPDRFLSALEATIARLDSGELQSYFFSPPSSSLAATGGYRGDGGTTSGAGSHYGAIDTTSTTGGGSVSVSYVQNASLYSNMSGAGAGGGIGGVLGPLSGFVGVGGGGRGGESASSVAAPVSGPPSSLADGGYHYQNDHHHHYQQHHQQQQHPSARRASSSILSTTNAAATRHAMPEENRIIGDGGHMYVLPTPVPQGQVPGHGQNHPLAAPLLTSATLSANNNAVTATTSSSSLMYRYNGGSSGGGGRSGDYPPPQQQLNQQGHNTTAYLQPPLPSRSGRNTSTDHHLNHDGTGSNVYQNNNNISTSGAEDRSGGSSMVVSPSSGVARREYLHLVAPAAEQLQQ